VVPFSAAPVVPFYSALDNPAYTIEKLKTDYFIVNANFQLGDVLTFSNSRGEIFHAAVYLSGNLVFGKNGLSPMAPWTIIPLDRMKGYYLQQANDWIKICYRRKDL
jgi:cell wall-associated NlpC family hydrolase